MRFYSKKFREYENDSIAFFRSRRFHYTIYPVGILRILQLIRLIADN